jgi:signal transduction histidine kinase
VQEGLTNARKHAPGSLVDVKIARDCAGQLTTAVVSVPRVGVITPQAAASLPGTGSGLIGLTERVTLSGGRLSHGHTVGGGFALKATLPPPP